MKKRFWITLMLMLMSPMFSWAFSGGDGTVGNPYQIATPEDFEAVTNNPAACYVLLNNIDFSGRENSGGPVPVFSGIFDGGGYAITNMTVNASSSGLAYILGTLQDGGVIRNLRFGGCNIYYTSGTYISPQKPMIGENYGTVTNCVTGGKLVSSNRDGGLIIQCHATDIPNGSNEGLIAYRNGVGGVIRDSSAYNGQLLYSNNGEIYNCQTSGEVVGLNLMSGSGGFVHNNGGLIKDSSTTACLTVVKSGSAPRYVGNFVGENGGRIENCSAAGIVRGSGTHLSGFVVRNYGELNDCVAAGTAECVGNSVYGLCMENGSFGGSSGLILDCQADIKISGYSNYSVGLVSYNYAAGTIINSRNVADGLNQAGITVRNDGVIFNSHNEGEGCLAGIAQSNYGRIECCSSVGAENSQDLVGTQYSGSLRNSFCVGDMNLSAPIANGLAGQVRGGTVLTCFSTGRLVGQVVNPEAVQDTANFWDAEYSFDVSSAMGTGKTTAAMKTESTFTDAGWDFDNVWMMSDPDSEYAGYPVLRPDQELKLNVTFVVGTNLSVRSGDTVQAVPFGGKAIAPEVSGNPGWLFGGWDKSFDNVRGDLTVTARSEAWIGSGTEEDPYQVSSRWHLEAINYGLGANYILANDIDLSGITYEQSVIRILNPGPTEQDFFGTLNGMGYAIRNLNLETLAEDNNERFFALFEQVSGTIRNLSVVSCSVNAPGTSLGGGVGGMVGANLGVLSNCFASGTVTGNCQYVGGLCAGNIGTITDSSADVSIGGAGYYVGGLAGGNEMGAIVDCSSQGCVTGTYYVGGLIGRSFGLQSAPGTIAGSFSSATVSGMECAGGMAGRITFSTVENSYATGAVTCSGVCGGLVGELSNSQLLSCYSIGRVNAQWVHAGLVGDSHDGGGAQESFWNIETSEHATSACGTGKTTEQMKEQETYWNAGWDFVNEWAMSTLGSDAGGYPVLQWQVPDWHTVVFNVGEYGIITGGDAIQAVVEGSAAAAPAVTPNSGWTFEGWDKPFNSVFTNLTINAQYLPMTGFALWADRHGLAGDASALFGQINPSTDRFYGFEYAFGTNLPPNALPLKLRIVNGRPVVEAPAQDAATLPYVDLRVVGSTNLTDWTLPVEPASDTTGKPADRAWYESEGVPPGQAFFKLEAELK